MKKVKKVARYFKEPKSWGSSGLTDARRKELLRTLVSGSSGKKVLIKAARRLEDAEKISTAISAIEKLTPKKVAKSPSKVKEKRKLGRNETAFRSFDCPRGKLGNADTGFGHPKENARLSTNLANKTSSKKRYTLSPPLDMRSLCTKDVEDLIGKGLPRRDLRAAIVDTCIRYGYTRQEAIGIADKHTRGDAPLGVPCKSQFREEHEAKDEGLKYTSAQIDQLLGNWKPRTAEVHMRHAQQAFRKKVLTAYGSACAVTGSNEVKVLDAAHIQPYDGPLSDRISNGICLRADIHKLFDAGLISLTEDFRVYVSNRVVDERYRAYHGQQLRLPLKRSDWPDLKQAKALGTAQPVFA